MLHNFNSDVNTKQKKQTLKLSRSLTIHANIFYKPAHSAILNLKNRVLRCATFKIRNTLNSTFLAKNIVFVDFFSYRGLTMKNAATAICLALIISGTGGCMTTPVAPTATTAQLLEEAQVALSSGKRETSVALLEQASKSNPASATPWLKQAQLHFDADNFPAAIQAADEAMKRDPANKEAKAIAVVASLRVAIRALSEMNQDSLLRGSSRSEAERLARALRETLAQDVLVPIDPTTNANNKNDKRARTNASSNKSSISTGAKAPTTPAARSETTTTTTTGSPFGALK